MAPDDSDGEDDFGTTQAVSSVLSTAMVMRLLVQLKHEVGTLDVEGIVFSLPAAFVYFMLAIKLGEPGLAEYLPGGAPLVRAVLRHRSAGYPEVSLLLLGSVIWLQMRLPSDVGWGFTTSIVAARLGFLIWKAGSEPG